VSLITLYKWIKILKCLEHQFINTYREKEKLYEEYVYELNYMFDIFFWCESESFYIYFNCVEMIVCQSCSGIHELMISAKTRNNSEVKA